MASDRGPKTEKSAADALAFMRGVAEKNGWRLNPDPEHLEGLAEGFAKNHNRYGFYQCPCRDSWGDPERDADISCPCAYCVADQAEHGHCYCGAYLTPAFRISGKPVRSIPERRPPELFP